MDLVFQRYADPIAMMGMMIRNRRFRDFTVEVVNFHNKDLEEKTTWEVWLHKVFDKSYSDFAVSLKANHEIKEKPSEEVLTSTVRDSIGILNGFRIE